MYTQKVTYICTHRKLHIYVHNFIGKLLMMTSVNNWLLDSQTTSANNLLLDSWTSANKWFLNISKQLIIWFSDDFGKQSITWFLDISKQLILGHQNITDYLIPGRLRQTIDYLIPGRLRQTIDYLIPGRILIFQIMYRAFQCI